MSRRNCELYQVTKVVGEKEVQVVERIICPTPESGDKIKKILKVTTEVTGTMDTIFTNKVIKEGVLEVGIIFADANNFVRFVSTQCSFMVEAEIPGALPGMQVQNQLVSIEQNAVVVTRTPKPNLCCEVFEIKIAARFLIKVTVNVQRNFKECYERRSNRRPCFCEYSTRRSFC